MQRIIQAATSGLLTATLLLGCTSNPKSSVKAATDSVAVSTPAAQTDSAFENLQDKAQVLAGISPKGSKWQEVTQRPAWRAYAATMDARFSKLDSTRLSKMRMWQQTELAPVNPSSNVLFYPFSGPDFLNAYTFFPNVSEIYMMALEAPGHLPNDSDILADTAGVYFGLVERSLWSVLNFSFFRTNSMKVDLVQKQLDGAVHLVSLFMQRTGNRIETIEPVVINENGDCVSGDKNTCAVTGIKIGFKDGKSGEKKKLIYFSLDISDAALQRNTCFMAFLNRLPNGVNTYMKSASYLLHLDNFSTLRKTILAKSRILLQDDSGMPLRFIDSSWTRTFYGTYDRPIPLFRNKYQGDLKQAYQTEKPKALPFGIGYDYKQNESNLMLFRKR
jgi:hypothetical protein